MLAFDNDNNYKLAIEPKTKLGKPAKVDGPPLWELGEGPLTLLVAEDGMSGEFSTPDEAAGVSIQKLTIRADADLGDGVRTITLEEDAVFGPALAETLGASLVARPKVAS